MTQQNRSSLSQRELYPLDSPSVLIELHPSAIDKGGIGVFAATHIKKAQRVAEGIHQEDYEQLVPWSIFKRFDTQVRKKIMDFCIGTPQGFIPPEGMDFNKLSIEWYFNHSCEPNLGFNSEGDFVALRDIRKGVELAYDYGLAESNPKFKMVCHCGSKACRKIITGEDWKDYDFAKRNYPFMLPTLRAFWESVEKRRLVVA